MQQVDRGKRFWWRVPEASAGIAAVPENPDVRLLRQGWRLPTPDGMPDAADRHRLIVSAADRSRFSRPRHLRTPQRLVAAAFAGAMLVASAAGFLILQPFAGGDLNASVATRWPALVAYAGFGIETVEVSGHRQANETDILDAVDLANVATVAALDWDAVRARIERTPWVDQASMTFAYPATLRIAVTERVPFAQWRRGGASLLVDKTGRILTEVQPDFRAGLMTIAGEGAPAAAPALFNVLAQFPAIREALDIAERVGERRWTLRLANGSRIELGAGAEGDGLAMLAANARLSRTVLSRAIIVDLRARHRPTMRSAGPERLAGLTKKPQPSGP